MGFRTGRVALGCRGGFLDGTFLLYTLAQHSPPCSLTPGHTALKLAGGSRAFAGGGLFCVRDSTVEQVFMGTSPAENPKALLGLFQNPGALYLNSFVSVPLRLCVL